MLSLKTKKFSVFRNIYRNVWNIKGKISILSGNLIHLVFFPLYKGDNFCHFLFALLRLIPFWKETTLKGKNLLPEGQLEKNLSPSHPHPHPPSLPTPTPPLTHIPGCKFFPFQVDIFKNITFLSYFPRNLDFLKFFVNGVLAFSSLSFWKELFHYWIRTCPLMQIGVSV